MSLYAVNKPWFGRNTAKSPSAACAPPIERAECACTVFCWCVRTHTCVCVRSRQNIALFFCLHLHPVPCALCPVVVVWWRGVVAVVVVVVVVSVCRDTPPPPPPPPPRRSGLALSLTLCFALAMTYLLCSYVTPSRETGLSRSRAVRRDGSCPALALQELKETQNRKLEQFQINSTNFTTPQHSKASQLPLP